MSNLTRYLKLTRFAGWRGVVSVFEFISRGGDLLSARCRKICVHATERSRQALLRARDRDGPRDPPPAP